MRILQPSSGDNPFFLPLKSAAGWVHSEILKGRSSLETGPIGEDPIQEHVLSDSLLLPDSFRLGPVLASCA